MSKTQKYKQGGTRPRQVKKDHETKSDIKFKVLTGYYFEEEMNSRQWQIAIPS